jgi:hypothetical protein
LLGAELVARGLPAFSQERPLLAKAVTCLDLGGRTVWPPAAAQPNLGAVLAAQMVPSSDRRLAEGRWRELRQEEDQRLAADEVRRAERETKRLAEEERDYYRSFLRR